MTTFPYKCDSFRPHRSLELPGLTFKHRWLIWRYKFQDRLKPLFVFALNFPPLFTRFEQKYFTATDKNRITGVSVIFSTKTKATIINTRTIQLISFLVLKLTNAHNYEILNSLTTIRLLYLKRNIRGINIVWHIGSVFHSWDTVFTTFSQVGLCWPKVT